VGALAIRQVVLLPFPFSDLSRTKLRPAVVLADVGRGDWLLCQITSNPYGDAAAVALDAVDFAWGSLDHASTARPGKLFAANEQLVARVVGGLSEPAHLRVVEAIVALLHGG